MKNIVIDKEVFNSAAKYQELQLKAGLAAEDAKQVVEKLAQAANETYGQPIPAFQIMPLNVQGGKKTTEDDFAVIFQDVTEEGMVRDMAVLDLSFAVHPAPHGELYPSALVRYKSGFQPPQTEGAPPSFMRHPEVDEVIGADNMDILANKMFAWVFRHLPEEQHVAFLENCTNAGLVESDTSIGFGRNIGNGGNKTEFPAADMALH